MHEFTPLDDFVLVRMFVHDANKPKAGLILPDGAETALVEVPVNGQVVAVGPGNRDRTGKRMPLRVKPDDLVLVPSEARYDQFQLNGEEVFCLRETQILGIVREVKH